MSQHSHNKDTIRTSDASAGEPTCKKPFSGVVTVCTPKQPAVSNVFYARILT